MSKLLDDLEDLCHKLQAANDLIFNEKTYGQTLLDEACNDADSLSNRFREAYRARGGPDPEDAKVSRLTKDQAERFQEVRNRCLALVHMTGEDSGRNASPYFAVSDLYRLLESLGEELDAEKVAEGGES